MCRFSVQYRNLDYVKQRVLFYLPLFVRGRTQSQQNESLRVLKWYQETGTILCRPGSQASKISTKAKHIIDQQMTNDDEWMEPYGIWHMEPLVAIHNNQLPLLRLWLNCSNSPICRPQVTLHFSFLWSLETESRNASHRSISCCCLTVQQPCPSLQAKIFTNRCLQFNVDSVPRLQFNVDSVPRLQFNVDGVRRCPHYSYMRTTTINRYRLMSNCYVLIEKYSQGKLPRSVTRQTELLYLCTVPYYSFSFMSTSFLKEFEQTLLRVFWSVCWHSCTLYCLCISSWFV